MNYINKLASFAVLVIALSGCDFNEDFCIRNGELVAWCDFSGIKEKVCQNAPLLSFTHKAPTFTSWGFVIT